MFRSRGAAPPQAASDGRTNGARDVEDVLVNDRGEIGVTQSEVTIAAHGETIVVGFNDATGFYEFQQGITGWSVSTDGGASFRDGGGLPRIQSRPKTLLSL